jgi:hypothetical protein
LLACVLDEEAGGAAIVGGKLLTFGATPVSRGTPLLGVRAYAKDAAAEKPVVSRRLARAPAACRGPAPRLTAFGDYGNLAGTAPVWAGFYASFDPRRQRYRLEPGAPRTEYGWRIKVLWVVAPELARPARIVGRGLANDVDLWFDIDDDERPPGPVATLDPTTPGVAPTPDGYKEFPSYLYVPEAGCYELRARWAGSSWRLVFGLGQ